MMMTATLRLKMKEETDENCCQDGIITELLYIVHKVLEKIIYSFFELISLIVSLC